MQKTFAQRCYDLLNQVPAGKVTTYKILGDALGTKAYRAVGTAMAKNPNAPLVPCHRVVNTDGKLGGYAFGLDAKVTILQHEGIILSCDTQGQWKVKSLETVLYTF